MSDLISRSDVLDLLYGIFDKYKMSTDKNTSIGKSFGTDVFEEIRNMTTAYSVDKVVEELESEKRYGSKYDSYYEENLYRGEMFENDVNNKTIDKAIEIVKQGGVYDDVCEWRIFDNSLTGEPQWVYETTCGKYVGEEHTSKAFVYCPYCSKKIKVVE